MGLKVFLESSIMQKGKAATAGSKMLAGFIAPVDATVVELLEAAGVEIAGRIEIGEFGVEGLFGEIELTEAVNGADVVLCNDYTGAISCAAAAAGLYYVHPTYGTVSRYGLIQSVSSMDQIGILCKNPKDGFKVLEIMQGYDEKDGVMQVGHTPGHTPFGLRKSPKIPFGLRKSPKIPDPLTTFTTMQILCCGEIANNISKYDGVKYGYRAEGYEGLQELYAKSRTEAFGEDVKLAAILGAMVLSQENYVRYYDKAMRVRRMIGDSLEFDECDIMKTQSPVISRLCGLPSLTTPGAIYIAKPGCEGALVSASMTGACPPVIKGGGV